MITQEGYTGDVFDSVSIIYTSLLCLFLGALAAAAGLGGGAFYVPIFAFLLDTIEEEKGAIPLSKATILGAAIGNYYILGRAHNPRDDRKPLIDYDMACVMQPSLLLGTVIGVVLSILLPNTVIIVGLAVCFGYMTHKTWVKGRKTYEQENAEVNKDIQMQNLTQGETSSSTALAEDVEEEGRFVSALAELEEEDRRQYPMEKIGAIFALAVLVPVCSSIAIYVMEPCHWTYWVVQVIPIPILLGYAAGYIEKLAQRHELKLAYGYKFGKGDIQWTREMAYKLPLSAFVAGLMAGMFGIGGGMVMNPLMLQMGMHPMVSIATSTFLMLFTGSGSTIHFYLENRLPLSYWGWFTIIGLASGLMGQFGLRHVIQKTGRPSYAIFLLAGILGVAAVAMVLMGILDLAESGDASFKFDTSYFTCDTEVHS